MTIMAVFVLFTIGLVLIVKGGDWFVDAAEWFAEYTGIPHFIVGATVVSLGTTMPELFVSVNASLKGISDIAIGNAIGSTICNTGLVAGIIIMFSTTTIHRKTYIKKGSLLIIGILTSIFLANDLIITKVESIFLFIFLGIYVYINVRMAKDSEKEEAHEDFDKSRGNLVKHLVKFIVGLILIIFGSNLLVDNGVAIARYLNVPEGIIALTLVALGTSLPELITGITSLVKGKHEIGLGNIIGANILNYVMIIPMAAITSDNGLILNLFDFSLYGKTFVNFPQTLIIDMPFSLLMTFIFIIPSVISKKNFKLQGAIIFAGYLYYINLLVSIVK